MITRANVAETGPPTIVRQKQLFNAYEVQEPSQQVDTIRGIKIAYKGDFIIQNIETDEIEVCPKKTFLIYFVGAMDDGQKEKDE